jgi:hypothetical protein
MPAADNNALARPISASLNGFREISTVSRAPQPAVEPSRPK